MCLIIHKPIGQRVEPWIIKSAMKYNPDGIGIMAPETGSKVVKYFGDSRKPSDVKRITKMVNKLEECAIHFRWATHGDVSFSNIHPFRLADDGLLMHNGILYRYSDATGGDSDTKKFVDTFMKKVLTENPGELPLDHIEQEIGHNAVLIQDPSGQIHRLGHGWNEYDGCHFSNTYAWDAPFSKSKANGSPYASNWSTSAWDAWGSDLTDADEYWRSYFDEKDGTRRGDTAPRLITSDGHRVTTRKDYGYIDNREGKCQDSCEFTIITDLYAVADQLMIDHSVCSYVDDALLEQFETERDPYVFIDNCSNPTLIRLWKQALRADLI